MEKREKIKKVYEKLGIKLDKEYLKGIMVNKPRVEEILKIYEIEVGVTNGN